MARLLIALLEACRIVVPLAVCCSDVWFWQKTDNYSLVCYLFSSLRPFFMNGHDMLRGWNGEKVWLTRSAVEKWKEVDSLRDLRSESALSWFAP